MLHLLLAACHASTALGVQAVVHLKFIHSAGLEIAVLGKWLLLA